MLEVKIEMGHHTRKFAAAGSPEDLVAEVDFIIASIYHGINSRDKVLSTAFKRLMTRSLEDPSPVWDLDPGKFASQRIVAIIPHEKEE